MDINSLKDNLNKSLADVSTKGIPSANFEPVWINNITRLNAQNFNARMYPTIASYITGYGNAVFEGSNEQLSNLLSILPGYKVEDTSTSEIHNLNSDLSSTNEANGAYQAVFGIGNIAQPTVTGQFLIGTYSDPYTDTLFAVGNGSNDNQKSNALEVTLDGTLKSSKINVADDITAKYITLTEVITDSSNDKYAATKKYVFDKVKTETDRATTAEQLLTTNLNKEINRAKAEEDSIRAIASSAFHFKGSKPTYDDLPKTDNTVGDVWQVDDKEYAWNGTEWVELGFNIDLSDKQDKFADLDYVWDGDSFEYLTLSVKNAIKKTSTGTHASIVSKLRLSTEMGNQQVHLTAGSFTVDPADNGRYSSGLYNNFLMFKDQQASDRLYSMLITPTAHTGTTPAYLTLSSPAQNTAVGHANIRLTGIAAPTSDNDAANKAYVDTNFQEKLVSGTNIRTINNQSLLGSGNIDISGGGGTITVDAELSETSTNPVQNKIINEALNNKQNKITSSTDLVLNRVILGNAYVILSGDYNPTTGGTGYMLKIGGDIISDPVRITNVDDGVAADNAVNKKQLDTKQDKFATLDSSNKKISLDPTKYDTIGNEGSSITFSSYTTLHATTDVILDAAGGDVVINGDSPSVSSSKYMISWDSTNEAIKITFKE